MEQGLFKIYPLYRCKKSVVHVVPSLLIAVSQYFQWISCTNALEYPFSYYFYVSLVNTYLQRFLGRATPVKNLRLLPLRPAQIRHTGPHF